MFTFLNTIILLGALQGFIISILLWLKRGHRQANRLLAVLILLMSMASFNLYAIYAAWFDKGRILPVIAAVVPLVIVMPMGPLIYYYIRSVIDPGFRLTRRHKAVFFTAVIDMVPEIAAIIFFVGVPAGFIVANPRPWGLFIDDYNMYVDIPRWLLLSVYIWISFRYIRKKSKEEAGNNTAAAPQLKWLRQFITAFLVFQVLWLVHLVPYVIPAYSNWLLNRFDWYPVYIPLAILIYWLGIKGYMLPAPGTAVEKTRKPAQPLAADMVANATALLKKAMEEDKLYLNPALQVQVVAAHTGIPAKTISAVLNQHLQTGFAEWVNAYRVEEFKRKVRGGDLRRLTISAIASECGFNSQASFQRIFRQSVGMAPSEYFKQVEKDA